MKKFDWAKRGATAVVMAGLLATAMPATVLAAEGETTPTTPTENGSQEINKVWNYGDSVVGAETNFTFKLTYNKVDSINGIQTGTASLIGQNKGEVTFKTSDATPNDADKVATGKTTLKSLVNQFSFSAPGQYYFTLSEVDGNNPNITYSGDTYTVRVDVVWKDAEAAKGDVTVDGMYILTKNTENKDVKTDSVTFTNNSAAGGQLSINKDVAGTAANTEDYFKYTLSLTGDFAGTYSVTVGNKSYPITISEDGKAASADFFLKDGETATVTGLPVGTDFTVTEAEGNVTVGEDGSLTYVDGSDNGYHEQSMLKGAESWTGSSESDVDAALTVTGQTSSNASEVLYKNNKGFAPETGITMNTLPFVAVAAVAVAGGVTLIISRNRRAHEDF